MAPSGKRARRAKQRAAEEAAAQAAAVHSIPSSAAALALADAADADAEEHERIEVAKVNLTAYCVSCHTTDPDAFSQRMRHKRGRHGERVRRCQACVAAAEAAELQAATVATAAGASFDERLDPLAAARPAPAQDASAERTAGPTQAERTAGPPRRAAPEAVECASCHKTQPAAAFSRTQLSKLARGGSARCVTCTASSA